MAPPTLCPHCSHISEVSEHEAFLTPQVGVPACRGAPRTQVRAPAQSRKVSREKAAPLTVGLTPALPALQPQRHGAKWAWSRGLRALLEPSTEGRKEHSVQTDHSLAGSVASPRSLLWLWPSWTPGHHDPPPGASAGPAWPSEASCEPTLSFLSPDPLPPAQMLAAHLRPNICLF